MRARCKRLDNAKLLAHCSALLRSILAKQQETHNGQPESEQHPCFETVVWLPGAEYHHQRKMATLMRTPATPKTIPTVCLGLMATLIHARIIPFHLSPNSSRDLPRAQVRACGAAHSCADALSASGRCVLRARLCQGHSHQCGAPSGRQRAST